MRAHEFIKESVPDFTELKKPESLLPSRSSPVKKPKKGGGFPSPKVGRTERPGE